MKSDRTLSSSGRRIAVSGGPAQPAEAAEPQAYVFGPFRLVPGERMLRRGDQVLNLPHKAFETLLLLVRNSGHLMRKDDLMSALWPDSFVEEVSLASKISLLRRVLGDAGAECDYIQTVPKQGYRFLAPVTRTWASGQELDGPHPAEEERRVEHVIRLIALPFSVLNGDERAGFLGHSLPEAISASLAGLRSLTVRSSLVAARLSEGNPDPRSIAREADVDMVLAGSILCETEQVRVTGELIHAPSGTVVGSYVCNARLDNLIEVQDRIVHGIVDSLVLKLTEHERRVLDHDVPASSRAYEFYLRANYVQRQRTSESLSIARDLYRECLDEDPDYAPAWARLGRCYRTLEKFGWEGPQSLELAKWAFHRAFALSPDLSLAHNLYTPLETDMGQAQAAMVRLLKQEARRPNDPELFTGLIQACRYCGLLDESVRAHHRARQLDSRIVTGVAGTYFLLGDYERTLEWYALGARYYLDLAALAAAGREAEAAEALLGRTSPGGQFPAMMESLRYSLQGDHARSIEIVRKALEWRPTKDPEAKFYLARQLAREGEHAEALSAISELTREGFCCSTAMRCDPWLQPLSGLLNFQGVLDEVLRREADARAAFQGADGDRVLG
ncbi:winged helix-turn-helix domain-containing protein [Paludibaculum fermentans]|uniref:winged helix-turn-helix domain-containing protein n=1 Tax=Paludibaculum fermentans TaxID=1473598 RepID=UPI003EBB1BD0